MKLILILCLFCAVVISQTTLQPAECLKLNAARFCYKQFFPLYKDCLDKVLNNNGCYKQKCIVQTCVGGNRNEQTYQSNVESKVNADTQPDTVFLPSSSSPINTAHDLLYPKPDTNLTPTDLNKRLDIKSTDIVTTDSIKIISTAENVENATKTNTTNDIVTTDSVKLISITENVAKATKTNTTNDIVTSDGVKIISTTENSVNETITATTTENSVNETISDTTTENSVNETITASTNTIDTLLNITLITTVTGANILNITNNTDKQPDLLFTGLHFSIFYIAIVLGIAFIVFLLLCMYWYCRKKQIMSKKSDPILLQRFDKTQISAPISVVDLTKPITETTMYYHTVPQQNTTIQQSKYYSLPLDNIRPSQTIIDSHIYDLPIHNLLSEQQSNSLSSNTPNANSNNIPMELPGIPLSTQLRIALQQREKNLKC